MFEWSDLRYVLAISREGSLSGASRALGVDHTTVGRRLAAIEGALKARIFDKTPGGFRPTPAGELVLARARGVEEHTLAIMREVAGRDTKASGAVRVTGLDGFIDHFLLPNLGRFRARYPEIQLTAAAEVRVVSLSRREADIGIRYYKPQDPDLVGRKLASVASALYASRAYVESRGLPRDPLDLSGHDVIRYPPEFKAATEEAWMEEHGGSARIAVRVASVTSHFRAIRSGLGIGLHECHVCDADPTLVRISPEPVLVEAWWAVTHVDMARARRVRAVIDFLRELATEHERRLAGRASQSTTAARVPLRAS